MCILFSCLYFAKYVMKGLFTVIFHCSEFKMQVNCCLISVQKCKDTKSQRNPLILKVINPTNKGRALRQFNTMHRETIDHRARGTNIQLQQMFSLLRSSLFPCPEIFMEDSLPLQSWVRSDTWMCSTVKTALQADKNPVVKTHWNKHCVQGKEM